MQHDVGAQRKWTLPGRGEEGVVDHNQSAHFMGSLGDGPDVGDAQQRIAGRLDPYDSRLQLSDLLRGLGGLPQRQPFEFEQTAPGGGRK